MRPALVLADAAQVLLDLTPVAGQAGAQRPGALGPTLDDDGCLLDAGRPPPGAPGPSCGHDDRAGVRHRRIEQLDLDPDHRVQPRLAGGVREPDRAVEALVVGDRESGQAQLDGAGDQLIGRGGAVEE